MTANSSMPAAWVQGCPSRFSPIFGAVWTRWPARHRSQRPTASQHALRLAAGSVARALGRAEAGCGDHLSDLDGRWPLASHRLRRPPRGQAGGVSAARITGRIEGCSGAVPLSPRSKRVSEPKQDGLRTAPSQPESSARSMPHISLRSAALRSATSRWQSHSAFRRRSDRLCPVVHRIYAGSVQSKLGCTMPRRTVCIIINWIDVKRSYA